MILASLTLFWALSGPASTTARAVVTFVPGAPPGIALAQRGSRGKAPKAKQRRGGRRVLGGSQPPKQSQKKGKKASSEPRSRMQVTLPAGEPEDQIREWFAVADYDLNDWISYREAKKSLAFDQLRFRVYDTDHDGRIRFSEFKAFHDDSVYRGGRFRAPRPEAGKSKPPQRSPELLRNAYDLDLDGEIGLLELARILIDYGRDDMAAETALASLDADRNERLGPPELLGLTGILHPIVLPIDEPRAEGAEDPPQPQSISELFGRVSVRHEGIRSGPTPPLIIGPVPHFRRLDINDDGSVSVSDLEGLLRPLQLRIRVHSVISTLDRDGDGVLSTSEFESALANYDE